jgi:hypothetical protein
VHGAAVGEGGEHGAFPEQEREGEAVRAYSEPLEEKDSGAPLPRAEVGAEERISEARRRAGYFVEQFVGEARWVRLEDVRGEMVRGAEEA